MTPLEKDPDYDAIVGSIVAIDKVLNGRIWVCSALGFRVVEIIGYTTRKISAS